ncbi:hypothetical protein ACFWIQ_05030 [Kitasatospora sp. NPDC127059]|uniref:hypothetical protein n=1 Tax=unclassified Kitasatospora TaxID=2633591 RepID=UPI00365FD49A
MNPAGFHEATVKFTGQGVITATSEVIDDAWNPLHVQLEGPWVHLVKDSSTPTATVHTVPAEAIQAITWEWPSTPSTHRARETAEDS